VAGEDEEGGDRKRWVENESSQAESSIPDGKKTVMAFTHISKQKCTKKFHSFVLHRQMLLDRNADFTRKCRRGRTPWQDAPEGSAAAKLLVRVFTAVDCKGPDTVCHSL
jgi:hypothetical protein